MDLRLKFIDVKKSDVIATSGVIVASGPCAYTSSAPALKYSGIYDDGEYEYYLFIDGPGNATSVHGEHGHVNTIDKDGNDLGTLGYPTVGKYYHYDRVSYQYYGEAFLFECENENHHVTFE